MSVTLINVGPVAFQIAPLNATSAKSSQKVIFASHDVLGAAPPLEHTGFENEELTIEGIMYPETFGGMSSLDVIEAAKLAATPLPVIRGDYRPLGWFVIESAEIKHDMLNEYGIGREISVTLKLKAVGTPAGTLAAAIFALFG